MFSSTSLTYKCNYVSALVTISHATFLRLLALASDHMTNAYNLFTSNSSYASYFKVRVTYRSLLSIVGKRSI